MIVSLCSHFEGGKGTWGKEGSEIEGAVAVRGPHDPNYDSEDVCISLAHFYINQHNPYKRPFHVARLHFSMHAKIFLIRILAMCPVLPLLLKYLKQVLKAC
jgi:hypothetical protein